jgi:hypothetical protein
MFWVLDYFLLCSMPSITPINTPFLHLVKLYSLHLHSHIHEPLAPPPPPHTSSAGLLLALALRGRWPLLPHGLLLDVGLVFPAGWWRAPPSRIEHVGGAVGLGAGSPIGSADPQPCLKGGGGDGPPFPASLLQSRLGGGSAHAAQWGDDAKEIRFTSISFIFYIHTN